MNAIKKIPVALRKELNNAADRIRGNAEAIYDMLDQQKGPVTVDQMQKELGLRPDECRTARRLLMSTESAGVYVTQDGLILTKYATHNDHRFWHLAWSLGLFEVSGRQLVLDQDMLESAPDALVKLWNAGKFQDYNRLTALKRRTRESLAVLVKVVEMYKRIEKTIDVLLLPQVASKDWKGGLRQIKKQLEKVS